MNIRRNIVAPKKIQPLKHWLQKQTARLIRSFIDIWYLFMWWPYKSISVVLCGIFFNDTQFGRQLNTINPHLHHACVWIGHQILCKKLIQKLCTLFGRWSIWNSPLFSPPALAKTFSNLARKRILIWIGSSPGSTPFRVYSPNSQCYIQFLWSLRRS